MNLLENQRVMNKQEGHIGTVVNVKNNAFTVLWDNGSTVEYQMEDQELFVVLLGVQCQSEKKGA